MTKILSKKELLKAKFFTVVEEQLEFPNGATKTHMSAYRDPSVAVFPIDDEGNIYLIDQYRYQLEKRIIEAVSGMVEGDEKPLDTAQKELREEAGITASSWKLLRPLKSAASIVVWDQYLFLARDLTFAQQELEEAEDITVVKMPLQEAVAMVMDGRIVQASTCVGILIVDKLLKEGEI